MVDLTTLGLNVVGALGYAFFGWKKHKDENTDFDIVKFGSTMLIGVVAGVIYSLTNPNQQIDESGFGMAQALLVGAGAPAIVENFLKSIIRK